MKKSIPQKRYEVIGTTADLGLRIRGRGLEELFQNAAAGTWSLITTPHRVRCRISREVSLEAPDLESLLVQWLNELIYLYETEDFLGKTARVRLSDPPRLVAQIQGETRDARRHQIKRLLKAATYHELKIEKIKEHWQAKVILDI